MWIFIYILYAIIGLILILLLILRPYLIKPAIIAVLIGTAGLVIKGRLLVDKYFMAIIALAIIFIICIDRFRFIKKPQKEIDTLHQWIFFLMIGYLIIQALRSALVYDRIGPLIWIIYFIMLGILSFFLTHNNLPKLDRKKISLIIVVSTLFYLTIYLVDGYVAEKIRGITRWSLQGMEWSYTANAVFALVIAPAAAIFLLKSEKRWHKILGITFFIISSVTAYYYRSDSAWIALLSFLIVSPTIFSFRKVILWYLIFLILIALLAIINRNYFNFIVNFPERLISVVFAMFNGRGDFDRYIHLRIPFRTIEGNAIYALFGHGFDSYKIVLIPYLEKAYNTHIVTVSTTGFSALLVDTGLVGFILLFLNFIFTAIKIIIQKNNPGKIILLTSLTITAMWLPITQVLGVILFYFLIMPGGLLIQLSETNIQKA
jgi:hypothetical protein